jgi:hypothetical protein
VSRSMPSRPEVAMVRKRTSTSRFIQSCQKTHKTLLYRMLRGPFIVLDAETS